MRIRDVIEKPTTSVREDSFSARSAMPKGDGADLMKPGSEPTVIRVGSKLVKQHDPNLMPDVLPLASSKIEVNGKKARVWSGIDIEGNRHTFWSYDTADMSEDQDGYLQAPLDPEGDTNGPGKTGDEDDIGEGEVVQFKRPGIGTSTPNLQMAKQLAKELFWVQCASHYTKEEEAEEQELEDKLAKIGYRAVWDLDAPEFTVILTHIPSGRQLRMEEKELIDTGIDEQQMQGTNDQGTLNKLADQISRQLPAAAGAMARLKKLGALAARAGAPLAMLISMASYIASAEPADKQAAVSTADMTFRQMMQAVDSARNGKEAEAILSRWLSVKRPVGPLPPDPKVTPELLKKHPEWMPDGEDINESENVWDKPNPVKKHKKLSPADKAAARARAKRAGRKYPNMVDNIWAARR